MLIRRTFVIVQNGVRTALTHLSSNIGWKEYLPWYGKNTFHGMERIPSMVWKEYLPWYGKNTFHGMERIPSMVWEVLLPSHRTELFPRKKIKFISKSPAMEGEIFCAFLILGTMSTMVSRRIFDKRANYVERFVKRSGYSEYSRWKMYLLHQFISKSRRWRVKYFVHF